MRTLGVFAVALSLVASPKPLRISENRRFLVEAEGKPFFWLGDTAWELFHRLNREDAERYLENRRQKGFTVILAVVLAEMDGLGTPNMYGELPLIDRDPTKPNEAYFRHVDWIIRRASEKGLYIALLPTWGNKVSKGSWEKTAPIIFSESNARTYGKWIGDRYKNEPNLIWVLGGDRNPMNAVPVWRAMAEGIRESDTGRHLITFHPNGAASSSTYLHEEPWLDINMIQSGHVAHDLPNFRLVEKDYARQPVKPVLDGEPRYEDHPVNWKPQELGWFDDVDVRQAAYWAVFAGAFGHTYGCHPIWQFATPDREKAGFARHNWNESLDLPGASQLKHLRRLMESHSFLTRVPAQDLLIGNPEEGPGHAQATRGEGYALVYIGNGSTIQIDGAKLGFTSAKASWYDPRTGSSQPAKGETKFTPPGEKRRGNDWVLVLESTARSSR